MLYLRGDLEQINCHIARRHRGLRPRFAETLNEPAQWIDFDFHGHQIVAHLAPEEIGHRATNAVDGHEVPVRHFGAILTPAGWQALAERLTAAGTRFVIAPHTRFPGEPGEQSTMFFLDPSGNALEFKAFADDAMVFAR